jgi:hypothetical protein
MKTRIGFSMMVLVIALLASPPAIDAQTLGTLHEYAPVSFWANTGLLLDDPNLNEAYEEMAALAADMGKTCYDADSVKTFFAQMFAADFGAVSISGNQTLTYYKPDGSIEAICQYDYVGLEVADWMDNEVEWHKYEQVSCLFVPGIESEHFVYTPYKYLVTTPIHQNGENGMIHAHIRYGDTSFDDLINGEANAMWWPTLGLYGATTLDVFMADFAPEEFVFMLPDCQ